MKVVQKTLNSLYEIFPEVYNDNRGSFLEKYHKSRYQEVLNISENFVQQNFSTSYSGVVRGLHFQKNYPQGKLVSVSKGKIYDVAVDLRKESKTYCQCEAVIIDDELHNQLWIHKGFAHGFMALSEEVKVEYLCTEVYMPEDEECLLWNDPSLNIDWPIKKNIKISDKDARGKLLERIINEQ